MDKKALQLCARFALQPNLLGYCGRDSAPAKLYDCIVNGKCEGVEEEFEKFIVLNPYIQTISQITGKGSFSYEVIEAYWLGSELLKQIKPEHYDLLVDNLAKQGVPDFLIAEIKDKKPKDFIPIHLFNILHVGVGKASGSVPFNLESINNCMVRWGKVSSKGQVVSTKRNDQEFRNLGIKELKDNPKHKTQNIKYKIPNTSPQFVTVQTIKLIQKNWKYELVENREEAPYLSDLVGELKVGDNIVLHWGWVAMQPNQNEINHIQKWTRKLLKSIVIG